MEIPILHLCLLLLKAFANFILQPFVRPFSELITTAKAEPSLAFKAVVSVLIAQHVLELVFVDTLILDYSLVLGCCLFDISDEWNIIFFDRLLAILR